MSVRVFVSYSREDTDLKKLLEKHLSPLEREGLISVVWSDDKITAGTTFDPTILDELQKADIILLLLSSSFFSSDYCWNIERRIAVDRHESGKARAIPILLRSCNWEVPPINRLNIIPKNAGGSLQAVTSWTNLDEALAEVVNQIAAAIREIEKNRVLSKKMEERNLEVAPTTAAPRTVFHCVPVCECPMSFRQDGITELLPDVVLRFVGEPIGGRFADIFIFADAMITSSIEAPSLHLSEAILSVATGQDITKLTILRHGIHATQTATNALGFFQVPLHELGRLPPEERNLRISNVRVNAALVGVSSSLLPSTIQLFIKVSDTTVSPSSQLLVGEVAGKFFTDIVAADPRLNLADLTQTESLNVGLLDGRKVADHITAKIVFRGELAPIEPYGARTRLLLRFNNVLSGVHLFATMEPLAASGASATLILADSDGAGPSQKPPLDGHVLAADRSLGLSEIDIRRSQGFWGEGVAAWELDVAGPMEEQEIAVGIVVAYQAHPTTNLPVPGTCSITATRAPLSHVHTSSSTAPIPRFVSKSTARNLFTIVYGPDMPT